MKKLFLVALAVVLGFMACKKDEAEPQLSNKEILVAHKWKYSAAKLVEGDNLIDVPLEGDCETDNVYDFKENFEVLISTGLEKCYTDEPETYSHTYTLNADENTIQMPGFVPVLIRSISLDKMEWQVILNREGKDLTVRYELIEN